MGLLIPPKPLTKDEFEAVIKSGAKTLAEIDPKLWKWAGKAARGKYLKRRLNENSTSE